MRSVVIFEKDHRNPQAFITAAVGDADSDGLVWHPLVFRGGWNHPQSGTFHIGTKETTQMLANFEAGVPSQGGIPIDEDGMHQQRAEGAFGWIEKLEKRDGSVWGGIRWTPDGEAAVESGKFKFISARFETGSDGRPHPVYGDIGAVIIAGALVTRPFFYSQPQLEVAAGLFTHDPDAKDPEPTPGGNAMPGTALETGARERYVAVHGAQTDEQWSALTGSITTDEAWAAFITEHAPDAGEDELAKLRAEKDALQKRVDEVDATAKAAADAAAKAAADAAQTTEQREAVAVAASAQLRADLDNARKEITGLVSTVAEMQTQRTAAEIREEVAASTYGGNPLTPAAVEVVASARVNPSIETVAALLAHLNENDGHVGTYLAGEVAASVPPPDGASAEQLVNALGFPEAAKANILSIMAADPKLTLEAATNLHLDNINAGI